MDTTPSLEDRLSAVARTSLQSQFLLLKPCPYDRPRLTAPPIHALHTKDWPAAFHSSIDNALDRAWKESTIKNYNYAIKAFLTFCKTFNLPSEQCFPASEYLLCAFIASQKETVAASTIKNYISGIRAWHIRNGFSFARSERLSLLAHSSRPLANKKPPRPPITLAMLQILSQNLDRNSSLDCCILACASVAFWGLARLGELLPTSYNYDHAQPPHPTYGSISEGAEESLTVKLPWSKVSKWSGDTLFITKQSAADPISALKNHLQSTPLPPNALLFSFKDTLGTSVLLKHQFIERCNSIWKANGFATATGHSFRIGGTTHLLLSGVHPDLIKKMGRWSSDSFLRYWRNLDTVIPRNLSSLAVTSAGQLGEPRSEPGWGLQPVGLAWSDADSPTNARRKAARFAPS